MHVCGCERNWNILYTIFISEIKHTFINIKMCIHDKFKYLYVYLQLIHLYIDGGPKQVKVGKGVIYS